MGKYVDDLSDVVAVMLVKFGSQRNPFGKSNLARNSYYRLEADYQVTVQVPSLSAKYKSEMARM